MRWNSVSHVRMRAPRGQALRHVVKNHDTCTAVPPSRTASLAVPARLAAPLRVPRNQRYLLSTSELLMTTVLQPRTPVRAYRIRRTQSVVIMDPVRPAARSHGPAPRLGHSHQGLDHAGARLLHQRPIRPNRPYPDRPSPLRHPVGSPTSARRCSSSWPGPSALTMGMTLESCRWLVTPGCSVAALLLVYDTHRAIRP